MGKSYSAGDQLPASDMNGIVVVAGSYGAPSGGSDTYAMSVTPTPTSYATGDEYTFKADVANTGAATLNVNSLGAKTIKKAYNQDLATGDILANQMVRVKYDGTNFQLVSLPAQFDGALFGNLASIPSGAGVIPSANLPASGVKQTIETTNMVVSNPGNGVEADIFSKSLSGNTLGTNGAVAGRLYLTTESWETGVDLVFKLYYGSTVVATVTIPGASIRDGYFDFIIAAAGATNSQEANLLAFAPASSFVFGSGTGSEDSTGALNIKMSVTASSTNPGDDLTFGLLVITKIL